MDLSLPTNTGNGDLQFKPGLSPGSAPRNVTNTPARAGRKGVMAIGRSASAGLSR